MFRERRVRTRVRVVHVGHEHEIQTARVSPRDSKDPMARNDDIDLAVVQLLQVSR